VTSEDGDVTLRIPFGAVDDTSNIVIRVLSAEEYPPVLRSYTASSPPEPPFRNR
jgi:hypothetical protein